MGHIQKIIIIQDNSWLVPNLGFYICDFITYCPTIFKVIGQWLICALKITHFDDVTIASCHFGPRKCFSTMSPIDLKEKKKKILLRWLNMLNWILRSEKFVTSLIFTRRCHDQMRAIFGYTFSQLRYTAKLTSIELALWLIMAFEIWHFCALSRDTWWRHDAIKGVRKNFSNSSMHLPSLM